MGWFDCFSVEDKKPVKSEHTEDPRTSLLDSMLKNSVRLTGFSFMSEGQVIFKDKSGKIFAAERSVVRGHSFCGYTIFHHDPITGDCSIIKNPDLSDIIHLNSKENYEKFLTEVGEWFESGDGVFNIGRYKYEVREPFEDSFKDWCEGKIVRGTPELKLKHLYRAESYQTLKVVVDELVRMKLTGDVEVLSKGKEKSALLKEYFDHSWIDLGLKGTLFVQDLNTHEATSWSDVNVKRKKLSCYVQEIDGTLAHENSVELSTTERDTLKDIKHYVNKAKEIIGD